MIWYPSIGNKAYPYNGWLMKRPEYAWELLKDLGKYYKNIYSNLRRTMKWPPQLVDEIPLNRLIEIHDEVVEENKKNPGNSLQGEVDEQ